VLNIIGFLPLEFYLTGGTALSRVYLHHRYSDDLDFFVNNASDFKLQVNAVIKALKENGLRIEATVADEGFARIFAFEGESSSKLDFVNDVPYRCGTSEVTSLFKKTDNLRNILSNKITALGRYSPKDVVDIVYICKAMEFIWEEILHDASEKDLWVDPVNIVEVLEKFPDEKLQEIAWAIEAPIPEWFKSQIDQIIPNILDGCKNSLYSKPDSV